MRSFEAAAVLAVAAALLVWAFARVIRRSSMFFPDRYPNGIWTMDAEEHDCTTEDGVKLNAWLFRGAASLRAAEAARNPRSTDRSASAGGGSFAVSAGQDDTKALLLWFHGNGGNVTSRAPIAAELARRGVTVLLFDWRGYGKSDGRPTESGLYRDAEAAYALARSLGAKPADIVAYGESLGGPYAAYVASRHRVRCVVIENSFPSLRELGNAMYAPLPVGWTAPLAMRTVHWLNKAGVPVLVMHGERDQVIPFALGRRLYDGLRVRKEMLVSREAGHSGIPELEGERYYATVTQFIERCRT